jgi:hypothetical protein
VNTLLAAAKIKSSVTDMISVTVLRGEQHNDPSLGIVKNSTEENYTNVGDIFIKSYTIKVTNTGNVTCAWFGN